MFLGHYGVAFAAKRAAPRTSLGALAFAAQFLDELWPILLLLGVEQVKDGAGPLAVRAVGVVGRQTSLLRGPARTPVERMTRP